jgi:hypothetical protein
VVISVIADQTLQIAELKKENEALRAQVRAYRQDAAKPPQEDGAALVGCHGRRQRPDRTFGVDPAGGNDGDILKYEDLKHDRDHWKELAERYAKKLKDSKYAIKQWKEYCDKKFAQQDQKSRVANSTATSGRPTIPAETDEDRDITPRPAKTMKCNAKAHIQQPNLVVHDAATSDTPSAHPDRSSSRTVRVTSSQSTDPGSDSRNIEDLPSERQISSDDEPVVLEVRSLKRKRGGSALIMPPPAFIKQESKTPEMSIEIKSEDYSSPVQRRHVLDRKETSDLDAIIEPVTTPRRRRAPARALQRAGSEEVALPPKLSSRISSLAEGDLLEPDVDAQLEVLRPLSTNLASPPRPRSKPPITKRKQNDKMAAAKAALLSEDGESQNVNPNVAKQPHDTPPPVGIGRLNEMLDGPSAGYEPLARDTTPRFAASRQRAPLTPVSVLPRKAKPSGNFLRHEQTATKSAPRPSRFPVIKASAQKPQRRAELPPGIEDPPAPMRPEDEPLRLRPLSSLELHHFKINPKYAGSDFAFADAVRSKEQRRCLQGCTNRECCGGAFLKAVDLGAGHGSNETDAQVLEAYLGPNWEHMMGAYPRERRDDLLRQARAAAMANKHGKHRHAFLRHSTPPGFWRTDMPTTQERAEDRAKADEIIRQKVEERWREAMRDGGRWLFKDE